MKISFYFGTIVFTCFSVRLLLGQENTLQGKQSDSKIGQDSESDLGRSDENHRL